MNTHNRHNSLKHNTFASRNIITPLHTSSTIYLKEI